MALKKARHIVVRDRTFQWRFKGKKDRWGGSPRTAHIAIQEEADQPGKPLVAWIESIVWVSDEHHDGDTGTALHKARFTPGDVRKIIEAALDGGWDPSGRSQQFTAPTDIRLTDYQTVMP